MHNKILLLDHNHGVLDLADEMMYHGYSDLYICSDFRTIFLQIKAVQPDLIIWDCSELSKAEILVFRSIKHNSAFAHIPIILVSSSENPNLTIADDNSNLIMLKSTTAEDFNRRIEYLLAS